MARQPRLPDYGSPFIFRLSFAPLRLCVRFFRLFVSLADVANGRLGGLECLVAKIRGRDGSLNSRAGHACSGMPRHIKTGLWNLIVVGSVLFAIWVSTVRSSAADDKEGTIKSVVDRAVQPVMLSYSIAGMAVGLTIAGRPYVFNYGVASRATRKPVTNDTLFEIGSISKTFTATLASCAQANGNLSLADKTSKYLQSLEGSKFGDVTLLSLGTHTAGGFPLQLPESIRTEDQLMEYLKTWQPRYASGT